MYWYIKQESSACRKNHNQQLGTCHLHIAEILEYFFSTDLNSPIRKVRLKPYNRLN